MILRRILPEHDATCGTLANKQISIRNRRVYVTEFAIKEHGCRYLDRHINPSH